MTKTELVAGVAEKTGMKKKDAETVVNAALETMTAALQSGEKVSLVGFGTFEVHERSEREGRNPRTNEAIVIPASRSVAFKSGKALKDALNG